jgi:hypothetical protein
MMLKFRKGAKRVMPILAVTGGLWLGLTPAANAATGAQNPGATVSNTGLNPLPTGVTEPSTMPFNMVLPSGAACSKDSNTGQYTVNSYVVDNSMVPNPGTLTFPGGTPSQGTVLLQDNSGSPYSGEQTVPVSGVISQPPPFNWDNFQGAFGANAASGQPLYPATFNVGIMCADNNANPDKWWNAQITFAASSSDPNGFTWTIVAPAATPEAPFAIALPLSALGVAGVSLLVLRRRRRPAAPTVG